ncbi:hypothetical protein [Chryseobacterium sp. AG363]|uniref:hypothetical protein n=1 Tax=Chryseobacterium sp. AG363 TaxID=2183997 RepID=UPI000E7120DF|nr:hypothetical protein [Chryseobacterium sp. AG363]RKE77973.1 hypothetical protein DEU39_3617 [Chryseobacterium sp. AG363]
MSNWFEDNPTKSIIGYTLLIIGASWAFYKFTFEESKIDNYKSQIETKQATISQYQARIEYLEEENIRFKSELKDFEEWNSKSENPTLFYKSQYEKTILSRIDSTKTNILAKSNLEKIIINKSESYINKDLDLIIGLKDVSVNYGTYLNISYGNNLNNIFDNKKVGETIILKSNKGQIKITINKINYVYSNIEISIHK